MAMDSEGYWQGIATLNLSIEARATRLTRPIYMHCLPTLVLGCQFMRLTFLSLPTRIRGAPALWPSSVYLFV